MAAQGVALNASGDLPPVSCWSDTSSEPEDEDGYEDSISLPAPWPDPNSPVPPISPWDSDEDSSPVPTRQFVSIVSDTSSERSPRATPPYARTPPTYTWTPSDSDESDAGPDVSTSPPILRHRLSDNSDDFWNCPSLIPRGECQSTYDEEEVLFDLDEAALAQIPVHLQRNMREIHQERVDRFVRENMQVPVRQHEYEERFSQQWYYDKLMTSRSPDQEVRELAAIVKARVRMKQGLMPKDEDEMSEDDVRGAEISDPFYEPEPEPEPSVEPGVDFAALHRKEFVEGMYAEDKGGRRLQIFTLPRRPFQPPASFQSFQVQAYFGEEEQGDEVCEEQEVGDVQSSSPSEPLADFASLHRCQSQACRAAEEEGYTQEAYEEEHGEGGDEDEYVGEHDEADEGATQVIHERDAFGEYADEDEVYKEGDYGIVCDNSDIPLLPAAYSISTQERADILPRDRFNERYLGRPCDNGDIPLDPAAYPVSIEERADTYANDINDPISTEAREATPHCDHFNRQYRGRPCDNGDIPLDPAAYPISSEEPADTLHRDTHPNEPSLRGQLNNAEVPLGTALHAITTEERTDRRPNAPKHPISTKQRAAIPQPNALNEPYLRGPYLREPHLSAAYLAQPWTMEEPVTQEYDGYMFDSDDDTKYQDSEEENPSFRLRVKKSDATAMRGRMRKRLKRVSQYFKKN